jgi:hypothetical protein
MIFSLLRSLGRWKKAGRAPDASSTAHASVISYDADETAWRISLHISATAEALFGVVGSLSGLLLVEGSRDENCPRSKYTDRQLKIVLGVNTLTDRGLGMKFILFDGTSSPLFSSRAHGPQPDRQPPRCWKPLYTLPCPPPPLYLFSPHQVPLPMILIPSFSICSCCCLAVV